LWLAQLHSFRVQTIFDDRPEVRKNGLSWGRTMMMPQKTGMDGKPEGRQTPSSHEVAPTPAAGKIASAISCVEANYRRSGRASDTSFLIPFWRLGLDMCGGRHA
jgi:hypothetical protein